jgi:hypothetical protein
MHEGVEGEVGVPFKSQAQRRKFAELLVQGKISAETYEEWNRETGSTRLPEHVPRKRKSAKKSIARKRAPAKRVRKTTAARRK